MPFIVYSFTLLAGNTINTLSRAARVLKHNRLQLHIVMKIGAYPSTRMDVISNGQKSLDNFRFLICPNHLSKSAINSWSFSLAGLQFDSLDDQTRKKGLFP